MKQMFVLILITWCFSAAVLGMEDISLYSASVPVLSQSIDERTEAAKEGLKQVITKLTGTSSVIESNPDIKQELQRAAYYLQSFNYQLASISASQHTLNLYFNPHDIDYLLAKESIPIWHGKRPTLLLWLTYQDAGSDQIISDDTVDELLPQLSAYAAQRGLPLVLPLMDTQELSYISERNPKEIPLASFEALSKRYVYDALLVGYLVQADKRWQGRWTLVNKNTVLEWEETGSDANLLVANMLNEVGEYFFKESKSRKPKSLPPGVTS